ncbi:MAG: hypothetical protein M3483_07170, partial [Gemmatimonadota bacterium]|nr:hypothetical protein [Gemmatimonadota bacterium]
ALERALVLSVGAEAILPEHLPAELRTPGGLSAPIREQQVLMPLEEMERLHIERTLVVLHGNRTRAAESLGISRATLQSKIRRFGLAEVGRE